MSIQMIMWGSWQLVDPFMRGWNCSILLQTNKSVLCSILLHKDIEKIAKPQTAFGSNFQFLLSDSRESGSSD